MHWTTSLFAVASIWVVAAVTPGPNFLLTARIAVARSRAQGLAVVSGIAAATAIWGVCGLMGIQALFLAAPWAHMILKIVGAAYLAFLGVRLLANAGQPTETVAVGSSVSPWTAFRIGMVTSLANPRSALSVASVFAAALPPHASMLLGAAAVAVMVLISIGWYSCVVYLFGAKAVADTYARLRRWIDRIAGGLLILFGVKLALDRA
jgi:threonine/homoserine/homoserine lactone efflux protein